MIQALAFNLSIQDGPKLARAALSRRAIDGPRAVDLRFCVEHFLSHNGMP